MPLRLLLNRASCSSTARPRMGVVIAVIKEEQVGILESRAHAFLVWDTFGSKPRAMPMT